MAYFIRILFVGSTLWYSVHYGIVISISLPNSKGNSGEVSKIYPFSKVGEGSPIKSIDDGPESIESG